MQMHGDCVRLFELLDSLGENRDILTSRRFQSWFVNNVSEMPLGILNVFLEHAVNLNVHDGPRDALGSFRSLPAFMQRILNESSSSCGWEQIQISVMHFLVSTT